MIKVKHLKNAITLPFWLFTFSIIVFLVISQLIQDGMFVDGLLYVSVSKNLADGLGTFWNPHVSKTFFSSFHEQPPLYFKLLAFFYIIFGDSIYVERFFSFICLSSTAFYIHKLWKKIVITNNLTANNSWLPILLWISVPVCFWAYTNNVEETLMSLFVLAAVYHIYLALFLNKKVFIHLFIAGLFIFLSSLTKGIQGIFPVISVVAYYFIYKNISLRKTICYSLILIGIPLIIYGTLILLNKDVVTSFETYYKMRFVKTFNNVHDTTQNHFEILIRLFTELLPTIIISLFIFFAAKNNVKNNIVPKTNHKLICWFLLIGLSGSLPLMITL
jgi:4-amino-4-deoxy-L-arabinose transferase-like glycosyltransferase